MSWFALFAALITVTALLSWVNARYLKLPPAIGVLAASLSLSLVLTVLGRYGVFAERLAESILGQVDFDTVLMKGMLSFLLFAGALHVDIGDLLDRKWSILSLSTFGVILSTFLVGGGVWLVLRQLGFALPFTWALLFGALISPTDPIAVLGVLKGAGAPKSLESMIAGESLFNDGVGVVVFTILAGVVAGGADLSPVHVGKLFLVEALGGVLLGLALGYAAYRLIRSIDNYTVEILVTLSLVAGGYALAGALHTSGPIAMVVAGLFIGNHGRVLGMSRRSREQLDRFWELIDEILNAVLFVMIGLELLLLEFAWGHLVAGLVAVPLVLAVRFVSVGVPITVLRRIRSYVPHTVALMTWAGLRGGISIALALSLPGSPHRDLILVLTYCVVVFSVLVQGLTVGPAVRRALA